MALYEIVGTVNRHQDGTVGVILERDSETDEPTRWIDPDHPEDLSQEEVEKLSATLILQEVSESEVRERKEEQAQAGPTPPAQAPVVEGKVDQPPMTRRN